MTKFFVGQRVRVARPRHPANKGITGRIAIIKPYIAGERLPNGNRYVGSPGDCWIDLDRPRNDGGMAGVSAFYQLEPILPEGAQPSKFSFQELMEDLNERSYEK